MSAKIPIDEVNHDELADSLKFIEDCVAHAPRHPGLLALQDRIKQQVKPCSYALSSCSCPAHPPEVALCPGNPSFQGTWEASGIVAW
jgi:hypothetical protein